MKKTPLEKAKAEWEKLRDLPSAMAYSAAVMRAFQDGKITQDEAVAAAEEALVLNGEDLKPTQHISTLAEAVPDADPKTIVAVAKWLAERGVEPGDTDAITKLRDELAATLTPGLGDLSQALVKMIGRKMPPEASAKLVQHLFDTGLRADDIEGVDIMETPAGGVAHIRVKPGSRHSDSIGPTVGTA